VIDQSQPLPAELEDALAQVRPRLAPLGTHVLYFETIGSTNDVAAALVSAGADEGAVVIADRQTAGRGRRGHSWFSPPGAGLYISVVLAPRRARIAPERATALLTLAAGLAIAEAIEAVTGLRPTIKWPNDLLVGRRKLAGILAEGVAAPEAAGLQAVVLGFGVNVRVASFPPDLESRVTSLDSELGRPVDRAALCAHSLASLAGVYTRLLDGHFDAILDAWRARAPGSRGARVEWDTPSGPGSGITDGVDAMGALLVRTGDTVHRIVAGEVRWETHAASDRRR
jgi:BirA family biotin operon repressor/biotin-[acetyl-CoA-carboxylase] ligase